MTAIQSVPGVAGPIVPDTCYGELAINGTSLHTPAWCITDLSDLWGSYELRGQNRVIPGARGRKAYKRRVDETRYSFPMVIVGYSDACGYPYDTDTSAYEDTYTNCYGHAVMSYQAGLEANVAALMSLCHLDDPSTIAQSLLPATFTLPSGTVRSADVQVVSLRGQLQPGTQLFATLELVDPSGALSVAG